MTERVRLSLSIAHAFKSLLSVTQKRVGIGQAASLRCRPRWRRFWRVGNAGGAPAVQRAMRHLLPRLDGFGAKEL